MSSSLSTYEHWVRALRAWRQDPRQDLSHLPALDERTFPPATYERFVKHLNEAINEFMKRWQLQLSSNLAAARDEHEMARALVAARIGLTQRLRLARHPSFPNEIQAQLMAQAETDIKSLQAQLEEDAKVVASSSAATNRPQREAALRLIRTNALTAVLESTFSLEGAVTNHETARADAVAEHPRKSHSSPQDFIPRRPARRIFDPKD